MRDLLDITLLLLAMAVTKLGKWTVILGVRMVLRARIWIDSVK